MAIKNIGRSSLCSTQTDLLQRSHVRERCPLLPVRAWFSLSLISFATTPNWPSFSCFRQINPKMLLIFLILSLISLTSAGVPKELCTPDQVQSMKEKQSSCTSKILDKLMSIDSLQPSEVCKIINQTALGCTQSFGQCQVHEEVK